MCQLETLQADLNLWVAQPHDTPPEAVARGLLLPLAPNGGWDVPEATPPFGNTGTAEGEGRG